MQNRGLRDKLYVKSAFISDLHLGTRGCRAEALLEFLKSVEMQTLYLIGDIVDLESLRRNLYWPRAHADVLREVVAKARAGVRVVYVPGNHDADLREFIGAEVCGIEVRRDCVHQTGQGVRLLVTHGDEFDAAVRCSRWLAALGSFAYDLTLALNHGLDRLRRRWGYSHWSLVGYLKLRVGTAARYIAAFEHAAAHAAKRRAVDGIVCGHIHRADISRIDGMLYCNDGDWVENCSALVEDRMGGLALWRWAEVRESRFALAALGRAA
jgi:UDP-2,3-diacylglucosamine pyrophosphatase LpxH